MKPTEAVRGAAARPLETAWRSRARIGAAAAASVLLHLALARGLALTSVGAVTPPAGDATAKPVTRRETADYAIRAPRTSTADARPAHERPLAMKPVTPAVPAARDPLASAEAVATWQPREAALLERLTAGADEGRRTSLSPARPTLAAGSPDVASTPETRPSSPEGLAGEVVADTVPRPAAMRATTTAPSSAGIGPATPGATRSLDSLLDRMAATATQMRRPRGRQPAATSPATAPRANAADAALGLGSATPAPAAPMDIVVVPAPAAAALPGPAPAVRPRPAPGSTSVVTPFGSSRMRDEGETLSIAEFVGTDVPLGGTRGGSAAGPKAPQRVAAIVLPAESRARDVAEAFARRTRAGRGEPREGSPDGAWVATRGRADRMITAGLSYLARAQEPDGRWTLAGQGPPSEAPQLKSDTAATGLALLCFFGAGHDHFAGPHRDTIRRGLEFLLSVQKPDGDLFEPADPLSNSCAWLYSHGIASMALCEAVGMTGDALVKPRAERACAFIAASRHPERGGWRYVPGTDADLSVTGWMLVALRSGMLAGLDVDPAAVAGATTLLDAAATTRPEIYTYNPRAPDQRPAAASRGCMTAVGALMRLHTGWSPSDPRVVASASVLERLPPSFADRQRRDCYLWYYASQVLVHTGGPGFDAWYGGLVATLEPAQDQAGPLAGSWNPLGAVPDRWGAYGGRLYVTALHLLALEVPDRHLPTLTATD